MSNAKVKISKSVKFTPISGSSLVESYAREAGDLAVRFKSGATYIYKGVDNTTFSQFVEAPSKGKYFSANIKNKFTAEKAE